MDSHPELTCLSEPESYRALENGFECDSMIGFQVPILTELFWEYESVKKRLELGSHRRCRIDNLHSELLAKEVSGFPVIFMYRNIYDVYSSMKKLPGFLKSEVVDKIKTWKEDPNRSFRYNIDERNLALCAAQFFDYKNKTAEVLRILGADILSVSYDNFVHNPEIYTKVICKWLGINWHPDLLNHYNLEHSGVSKNGITMGNTDARRPIDVNSYNKRDLSKEEIKTLQEYDPWD
jgi:hypothetical protein